MHDREQNTAEHQKWIGFAKGLPSADPVVRDKAKHEHRDERGIERLTKRFRRFERNEQRDDRDEREQTAAESGRWKCKSEQDATERGEDVPIAARECIQGVWRLYNIK